MTRQPRLGRGGERPLTRVRRTMRSTPEHVFDTVLDAWSYPVWVVGATHVRQVDPEWPAPGARIHHMVGAWPLTISDVTALVESDPPHRLVLQGRAYPFGEVRIELTVSPDPAGACVEIAEAPTYGFARVTDNPLMRWLLAARNRESLNRLAAIVENRRS